MQIECTTHSNHSPLLITTPNLLKIEIEHYCHYHLISPPPRWFINLPTNNKWIVIWSYLVIFDYIWLYLVIHDYNFHWMSSTHNFLGWATCSNTWASFMKHVAWSKILFTKYFIDMRNLLSMKIMFILLQPNIPNFHPGNMMPTNGDNPWILYQRVMILKIGMQSYVCIDHKSTMCSLTNLDMWGAFFLFSLLLFFGVDGMGLSHMATLDVHSLSLVARGNFYKLLNFPFHSKVS